MTILPVQSSFVDRVWPKVADTLKPAVERFDGYSMNDILQQIKARAWQLWLAADDDNEIHACCVTTINVYPQKKTCMLLYLAGKDIANWEHLSRDGDQWQATRLRRGIP